MIVAFVARGIYGYGDFAYFHEDATAWWTSGSIYAETGSLNLNLPHVVLLMTPFGGLSLGTGWAVWTAIQIGFGCDALRRALRHSSIVEPGRVVLLLLVAPATIAQLALAQIAWLVAWLVTLAWETRRPVIAGMCIGLAAAMKPFLLLVVMWWVLRRHWAAACISTATCVLSVLFTAVVLGPEAYVVWAERVSLISWDHLALNWSLLGVWRRTVSGGLDTAWLFPLEGVLLLVALHHLRRRPVESHEGWVVVLVTALLLSPLGWGYYASMLIGPGVAILSNASSRRAMRAGFAALLWIPPAVFPLLALNTVGLMGLGLLAMRSNCAVSVRESTFHEPVGV